MVDVQQTAMLLSTAKGVVSVAGEVARQQDRVLSRRSAV